MSRGTLARHMVWASGIMLAVTFTVAHSQPVSQSGGIESFFERLPGDWIGTVSQSTDGQLADTKYFHAITKQLSPDIYETVFTYYRLDGKTREPVLAGVSGMATKIDSTGAATNSVTGKGDVQIEANTWKPETHDLTEVLRLSPTGGLVGTGSGKIVVIGMPLNAGKNGKVRDYTSTWSVDNDVLKISQRFNVDFRVLFFRQRFTITADYTANRGSDIIGLMKAAQAKGPGPGSRDLPLQ